MEQQLDALIMPLAERLGKQFSQQLQQRGSGRLAAEPSRGAAVWWELGPMALDGAGVWPVVTGSWHSARFLSDRLKQIRPRPKIELEPAA